MQKGCEILKVKMTEDKELANQITKRLRANDGYCPCKIARNEDTLCMCKEFREQDVGECHCGLYIKTEK